MLRNVVLLVFAAAAVGSCGSSETSPSSVSSCVVGLPKPAPTTPWPCPPASAIREIDAAVALEFVDDPTAGTLVCRTADGSADLTRLQERAYQALYLIKRLQFDAPLPWTTKPLWAWFTSNVQSIRYRQIGIAYYTDHVINMRVQGYSTSDPGGFPTDVSVLVHEAQHAVGGHTCDGGKKDRTIAEMGATGVQYYFGLWLADHTLTPDLTQEERDYARDRAAELRNGAFCTECGGL